MAIEEIRRNAMDVPMPSDDLMRVIALESFHYRIPLLACTLSYISRDEDAQARERLSELHLQASELKIALMRLPLPLHLCGILFRANGLDVGYEAAAIVALNHAGRWPYKATFTVPDVVAAMSGDSRTEAPIGRLEKAQTLFRKLVEHLQLSPTTLSKTDTADQLAVAFLTAPERLIWSLQEKGTFLGEPLVHECENEHFVAALFSKMPFRALKCALYLPWNDTVQRQSGITPPTLTFKLVGDSTFHLFRRAICQHLRQTFLTDVRCWSCQGGALETTLAEVLAKSPPTDTTVMCPNGNRLSGYDQLREPPWLQPNANDICGGLRETSNTAVLFVGGHDLCPGVPHPDIYARLIQLYAFSFARLKVPVVTEAPGVLLQEDRIHWRASSTPAVLNLMTVLMQHSAPTVNFTVCPVAALWHWKYFKHDLKHYPTCKACDKRMTDSHLAGYYHRQRCGSSMAGFAIKDRKELSRDGLEFLGSDNKPTVESLPPDRPLQVMTAAESEEPSVVNAIMYFEIVESVGLEVAKNTGLAKSMTIRIVWADGSEEEDDFKYLGTGGTRDAYSSSTHSWVLKLEKPMETGRGRNNCEEEWNLYMQNDELRKIIPRCEGYAAVRGQNPRIVGLLVEKLAFTMEEVYLKMRMLEATAERASIMSHVMVRSVQQMSMMAGANLYKLRDWHVCNIAFNHVSHAQGPVDATLIDWGGHRSAPLEKPRKRMEGAIVAFIKSLPGPHVWGYDAVSDVSETEQENMGQWKVYMAECAETVRAWWDTIGAGNPDGHIPTDFEISCLSDELCEHTKQFPPQKHSIPLWPDSPSGLVKSVPEPLLPGVHGLVMKALIQAAHNAQRHHACTFKKGQIKRKSVMSQVNRLKAIPPNLPHHGSSGKPHVFTIEEGNAVRELFEILLAEFRRTQIIDRVKPGRGQKAVPKQCSDPIAFHESYATGFVKSYDGNFDELEATDQCQVLESFLRAKFSTDKYGKCMVPEDLKRRKVLTWSGFYITEDELQDILKQVLTAYRHSRASARCSAPAERSTRSHGWYHRWP